MIQHPYNLAPYLDVGREGGEEGLRVGAGLRGHAALGAEQRLAEGPGSELLGHVSAQLVVHEAEAGPVLQTTQSKDGVRRGREEGRDLYRLRITQGWDLSTPRVKLGE